MIDLNELIKNAMKSHDTVALTAYRNLKTEIQKYETSKGAKPLTDSKQLEIISKYAAKLEDAILQFKEAGRDGLATGYTAELEEVNKLLPKPVTAQEILNFVQEDEYFNKYYFSVPTEQTEEETVFIQQIPKKDMGACIKYIKSKFPTANGKDISNIIKSMLI